MNRRDFITRVALASAAASLPWNCPGLDRDSPPSGPRVLNSFDYRGVKLLPGMFQPFYQVPERVPYRLYFDLDHARFL